MRHRKLGLRAAAAIIGTFALWQCHGQSFNIDLDVGVGDPGIGNGAPSSLFGGAAGQPGFWNRFGFGGVPVTIHGLDGLPTTCILDVETTSTSGGGGGGFAFTGNTGDYALLLNDAASVGTIVQGGDLTYNFSGLSAGVYDVYAYAANRNGIAINTPVTIIGATPETEVVTGPMPGNSLAHLITHSVHRVEVGASGEFAILFVQPPGMHTNMNVNGFQVAQVPEPGTFAVVALAILSVFWRTQNPHKGGAPDRSRRPYVTNHANSKRSELAVGLRPRSPRGTGSPV